MHTPDHPIATDTMFRALVEQTLAGIYVIRADLCHFAYVNPVFASIFGYDSPEEIIDRIPLVEFVAPADCQRVGANLRARLEGRVSDMRYCFVGQRKDGRRIDVEVHGRIMACAGGPMVIGMLLDITARKQAEAQLLLAAGVVAHMQEAVAITDLAGDVVSVNPAFEYVTEYSRDEVVGRNLRMLQSGRQGDEFYRGMWREILETGHWQGEIWNRRKSGEIYAEWLTINTLRDAQGVPIHYVGVYIDLSRTRHSTTHLEHLALHDPLTGLPNRQNLDGRLREAISRARRSGGQFAVLFVDLDRFKEVNDSWGHAAGDELLLMVAQRMREPLREIDALARLGGDEFVVVIENIADGRDASRVARRLVRALAAPFSLASGELATIGCSIGIALHPADGDAVETLIRNADIALYAAKRAGRGRYRRFAG